MKKYSFKTNYTSSGAIESFSIIKQSNDNKTIIALTYTEEDTIEILDKLNNKFVLELISNIPSPLTNRTFFIGKPFSTNSLENAFDYILTNDIDEAAQWNSMKSAEVVRENLMGSLSCYWKITEV